MKLLKAIIRPNKLEEVKDALTALNVTGMTVTEVRGHGRQKGQKRSTAGTEYSVTLLPKIMIELVLTDDRVEETLKAIITTARTGEIGDGRVFILPVDHGYNIRTGETRHELVPEKVGEIDTVSMVDLSSDNLLPCHDALRFRKSLQQLRFDCLLDLRRAASNPPRVT